MSAREQDARRQQILRAALAVIVERGFHDTRVADVAGRADVSPALVIYYFKTKDHLLTEAMRFAEDAWYEEGARRMAGKRNAAGRLEELVAMSCLPATNSSFPDWWVVWLDLWSQSVRHGGVARVREEFDERWRATMRSIVLHGCASGEFRAVDAEDFTIALSAMLDGFAVQIALSDPAVEAMKAFVISMNFAADRLGFEIDACRREPSPGTEHRAHGQSGT
jgi:AcrR family transcriptional regulator